MINFILIASSITLVALFVLIRPLLRSKQSSTLDRQQQNVHYAKSRLKEIEQQYKNGSLSSDDYDALKLEIESALAEDLDLSNDIDSDKTLENYSSNGVLIALLCGLIPFTALVLYQITGTPQALTNTVEPKQPPSQQQVDDMVVSLEQKLIDTPDDQDGWSMLARTYLVLGRYSDAVKANQKLLTLTGENPDIYIALADASALEAGGNLIGKPTEFIQRALSINPQHPQGLWLAGLSAAQSGNNSIARNYWEKLLPLLADVPEQQQELRDVIQQTYGADNNTQPVAKNINAIKVYVELAESQKNNVQDDDIVFVIAKAKNGPPVPLAVKRLTVKDLPTTIELSDSDAMVAQFRISLFKDIVISARVAKSENPVAQTGDIQSQLVETSNTNSETIKVTISERL